MNSFNGHKLPHRPQSHVIGSKAVNAFAVKIKPEWVNNVIQHDYGIDGLITIVQNEKVTDDFFVQLKGHDQPNYIDNKQYISEQIEVQTVNYLLRKSVPTMLCICDVKDAEKLFYVWVNEDIKRIENDNPNWNKQETVNFHVPVNNVITRELLIHKTIEDYVTAFHNASRNNMEIMNVLGSSLGIDREGLSTLSKDTVMQMARPTLEKAGLIDDSSEDIESYSPEDQELLRKIKETSTLITNLQYDSAMKYLADMSIQIEKVPDSIKAKYLNSYGVCHSHQGELDKALHFFRQAINLSPHNHRMITNYLLTEFECSRRHGAFDENMFKDWHDKLEDILNENSDFSPAIRAKAYFLGQTVNATAAEEYIVKTAMWEKEPLQSKICLSEIYTREDSFIRANELLKNIEDQNDYTLYSLRGFITFMLASGFSRKDESQYFTGAGPASLNYELLKEAEKHFKVAYEILLRHGLPKFSDEILVNYTTVLHLLFKHEEGLRVCRSLLDRYPDNMLIQGSIAACYLGLGEPDKGIVFAKKAFESSANSTTLKNYCVCLFEAEDYETIVQIIDKHIGDKIFDDEKGVFLSLLAISYGEIGDTTKSKEVISLMKSNEKTVGESISVEASLCKKNGGERYEVLNIFKDGKERYPSNMILLTNYAVNLNPSDKNEACEIISCFQQISKSRAFFPDEYITYSRSHLTLNMLDKALEIISEAYRRFPENVKILYELALTLSMSGDEEGAYQILKQYLLLSSSDYTLIKNLAVLAYNTGRIGEAISFLLKALSKTSDVKERGEIHCHLFELKKILGRPHKELLGHIHEFGKTVGDNETFEARYLSMFLLATLQYTPEDDESKQWIEIAKNRLTAFNAKNVKIPFFKSVALDMTLTEHERGKDILSTIMAEILPHSIKADKLRIATRSVTFPLTFRYAFLGSSSIFEYWVYSSKSKEKEDGLQIWNDNTNLANEKQTAGSTKKVCIDISALLTLVGFDLLDILQEFELIIIAGGTKYLIDKEYGAVAEPPHALAQILNDWLLQNRRKVRIRHTDKDESLEVGEHTFYETTATGILINKDISLTNLIGGGAGESVLIANQMRIPLYSDDSIVRFWANNEFNVKTFSTISLIDSLVEKGNITIGGATDIFARLIRNNYAIIPFESRHLHASLVAVMSKYKDKLPLRDDLMADDVLGTLMRQFGNPSLNYTALTIIAVEWWLGILADKDIPGDILIECMEPVSFSLSMHTISGIMTGIAPDEKESRLSAIWLRFLSKAREIGHGAKAWSAIKTVCERLYANAPDKFDRLLYTRIPQLFIRFLEQQKGMTKESKIVLVVSLTQSLPSRDKERLESVISKMNPSFMR